MNFVMDAREELGELLKQAREHLVYYRDLGLTHIGEETRPATGELPIVKADQPSTEPFHTNPAQVVSPPAPAELKESDSPSPTIFTPPQFLPKQEIMAKTKETQPPAIMSLFGDATETEPTVSPASETLEDIRRDLGECQRCKLWTTRTNIVFGEGNPKAELMFVGEAPGADEDASGRPFVGRAGQLLTKMIEAISLKREDVYIANILKSRPPGNRNPEADETRACIPFLYRQIASIRPKLIVTLGNPATQGLLETKTGISRLRGEFQDFPRIAGIKLLPTFHPAYLLRSPDKKREAWEDMKKVRAFLRGEIEP
jgi:uracil-DNA glycosylase family 4